MPRFTAGPYSPIPVLVGHMLALAAMLNRSIQRELQRHGNGLFGGSQAILFLSQLHSLEMKISPVWGVRELQKMTS